MSSNESCEMNLCPVNKAMEYVSKKWSIEIIRDMFFGKKRFSEFKEGNPNLSNKVLSDCLKNLESKGVIEKKIVNSTPVITEYYLTERGRSLNKVIYELAVFYIDHCGLDKFPDENMREKQKRDFREVLEIEK